MFESHVRISADIPEVAKIITVGALLFTIFTLFCFFLTALFKPLLWRVHWSSILMIRTLKKVSFFIKHILILCVDLLICVFLH